GYAVHGVHQLPPVPRRAAASQTRAHAAVGVGAPHRGAVRAGAVLLYLAVLVESAAVLGGAVSRAVVGVPRPSVSRRDVPGAGTAVLRDRTVRGAAADINTGAGTDHRGDDRDCGGDRGHQGPHGGPR